MSNWTEARVETLKALWAEGLTASQVAKKLGGGTTRNSVLSKVHRLGLVQGKAASPTQRRSTSSKWKPENDEILIRLWNEDVATAEIAARFGVTPAWISINARRLGLPARTAAQRERARRQFAESAGLPAEIEYEAPADAVTGVVRATLALQDAACRYPIGDPVHNPETFHFCMAPACDDSPYCAVHHALCLTPGREPVARPAGRTANIDFARHTA
jgi:GcrA cell cycle regulator